MPCTVTAMHNTRQYTKLPNICIVYIIADYYVIIAAAIIE